MKKWLPILTVAAVVAGALYGLCRHKKKTLPLTTDWSDSL